MQPPALRPAPGLAFVVPCFNEALVLETLIRELRALGQKLQEAGEISGAAQIVLVDDGSADSTWQMIEAASQEGDILGIKLARNHGHQPALLAGLMTAKADILVSLDADLQDDLSAVAQMIADYRQGSEIVFGVRASRKADTWFKRRSAGLYYALMKRLGVDLIHDHADFRLMSRKAVETLRAYQEVNLFLRGMVKSMGFTTSVVEYDRAPRMAGESKYPVRKMLALATEGITSFSVQPLRYVAWAGFVIAIFSFLYVGYAVGARLMGITVSGWASIVASIYMLGGIQLIALGIIGEYLGKVYLETKRRPQFIIETTTQEAEK